MGRFRIRIGSDGNKIGYESGILYLCAFHSIPIKSDPIRNLPFLLRIGSDSIRSVHLSVVPPALNHLLGVTGYDYSLRFAGFIHLFTHRSMKRK